jgi:excisionase family DNA binding protein
VILTEIASRDWLSIRDASRLLGVHIGTVREWADAGILPSYRTPGGHRRFTSYDLHTFLQKRQQHPAQSASPSSADHALGYVRQELQAHPLAHATWFQNINLSPNSQDRAQQREFGQDLLRTVVAFVEQPDHRDLLLDEGRRTARAYGRTLAGSGLSAGNAARATIYFRQLILKTVLDVQLGSRINDEEDARLFQRVSAFLDEILLAILDAYP